MNEIHRENLNCQFCDIPLKSIPNNFYRCKKCGNIYNGKYMTTTYEDSYFENEYKNQYGKSYIDDKPNIQLKMKARLEQVKPYFTNFTHKRLLEVGSAAGFFLEIAKSAGFLAKGWEISSYMADYANKQGNETIQGNFLDLLKKEKNQYDVIAAFYVIEHFIEQKKIWEGFSRLLKKNGILMLALPSHFGPAYHFGREKWLINHPSDHFIDYGPYGIKKVCSLFGLKLLHIYPEGLHPERFIFGNVFFLKYFYIMIQKKFKFCDTIFVVIQK